MMEKRMVSPLKPWIKFCAGIAFAGAATMGAASPAFAQSKQMINAFKEPAAASASSGAIAGPNLAPVNPTITAGDVTVGATAYVVVLFKNDGTAPVTVQGINLYPSSTVSAQVSLNKCAEQPLPPDGECAVTVAVSAIATGAWRVEMLLDHDGRSRLATAAMTGNVTAGANGDKQVLNNDISATPDAVDFGTAAGGGGSLIKTVLLRNTLTEAVDIKDITLEISNLSGVTARPDCPDTLDSGQSCLVTLNWAPRSKGPVAGVLLIHHSGKGGITQVPVSGTFDAAAATSASLYPESVPEKGLLVSDRDTIDFGTAINSAVAMTISLVNTGSSDLTLSAIKLSGSDSGLSVARSGCRPGFILKPVAACALTINWVPSRAGAVVDDLQILHTGARGVLILPIRGTADAAVSRESMAIRQSPDIGMSDMEDALKGLGLAADGNDMSQSTQVTPVLDGYTITSLSATRAVINGPVGAIVVRDGEDTVISGVKWTVTIQKTGVILTSASDEIFLVFDKSLKPILNQDDQTNTSSSSNSNTDTTTPATTTTTTNTTNNSN